MKLAYLILGHAHPEQIIRMIERLRPSASLFVVHIDARSPRAVTTALASYARTLPDVRLAPQHRCYWGSYGIVRATLACIDVLLASGVAFDYAALLSGQDYPVQRAEAIDAFFAARPGAEFIEAFPLAEPNRWSDHAGRFQALARVLDRTVWLRSRPLRVPGRRSFLKGLVPCGGSQWWCLSAGAVRYLSETLRRRPEITRYFKTTFIPDEAMIQTVLGNSPMAANISSETLTYIDWERPNPKYPRTLDVEDVSRVAGSGKLWARKIHPVVSQEWMKRVDRDLLA